MSPAVVYLLVLVAALCLQGGLALHGARYRHVASGRALVVVMLGGTAWTFLVGAMAVAEPALARALLSVKYLAIGATSLATFELVVERTGLLRNRSRVIRTVVGVVTVLGAVAAWRDGWGMIRTVAWEQSVDLTWVSSIAFGPIYWLYTAVLYATSTTSCVLLALSIARGARLARMQGVLMVGALVAVMACNVLLITGLADRRFDPMPVGLALSAVLLWGATVRHGLLELVPIARSATVDALEDGVIVVDAEGRVLDLNATMQALLGDDAPRLIGAPLLPAAARPGGPLARATEALQQALANAGASVPPRPEAAVPRVNVRGRAYDVRAFPVGAPAPARGARVIVLHDVTAIAALVAEQSRLIAELQGALGQVRTLTGLLPICASCKHVRDGDGAWHPLETYIRARTDAEFTHGICPACVSRLYPEYAT